jgi:uncharacterized protein (DUF1501 family)
MNRRDFLRYTGALGLSGTAALMLEKLCLTTAWAQTQTDYKALVLCFFAGGCDGNQLVVPLSGASGFGSADVTGGYPAYFNERMPYQPSNGLAIPDPNSGAATATYPALIPISAGAANPSLGAFGMNPRLGTTFNATTTPATTTIAMPNFAALYSAGNAAVVCNVGTLIQPISKAQYQANSNLRPSQLFSHSDQVRENQTCIFTPLYPTYTGGPPAGTGWGGRTTDKIIPLFNAGHPFPPELSVAGTPNFMSAASTFPLAIAPAPTALNAVIVLSGFGTSAGEVARKQQFQNLLAINQGANRLVDANSAITNDALSVISALSVDPTLSIPNPGGGNTVALNFPNTSMGNQFKQIAKVIKANLTQPALALKRQIFFVQIGGFDTHQNENPDLGPLLQQFNEASSTFYYWLKNNTPGTGTGEPTLGDLTPKVTVFTMSDFSRTFNPSADGQAIVGTDHAWASNWLVVGGSVIGNRFYGQPLPGGNGTVFVTLSKGTASPYDVDNSGGRGRWIPSTSTLQYANSLSRWFGLPQDNGTLDYVFPGLRPGNPLGTTGFTTIDLGFLP